MKILWLGFLALSLICNGCGSSSADEHGSGDKGPGSSVDLTPPTAPTNLNGTSVSSTQIDVAWQAATDNVGITSYSVYRCTGSTCTPTGSPIVTITGTTYNDTGLAASTTYSYAVTARDRAGNESPLSTPYRATTLGPPDTMAPTIPHGLVARTISSNQINLSWQPSTDNVTVASYIIHRCTGAGCTAMTPIATVQSDTLSYQDTGLAGNTSYSYAVSASDQAGNDSALSSAATARTPAPPDTTAPTVPTELAAVAQSSNRIDLSWRASIDPVGVTKYTIYRCTGSGCNPTTRLTDVAAPATSFSNIGLSPNTTYRYQISASDAANNESTKSNAREATTHPASAAQTFTLIGAGDIASSVTTAEATATLLDAAIQADPNAIVFTTGDNAYPNGTTSDFSTYYHPTWGRHKVRTRPAPGNHDYGTPGASDYLNYFCPNSADCSFPGGTKQLYYSYNLGNWHIVSLNSEAETAANSAQLIWLKDDLAAHPDSCVLAYWHRPRFTSGSDHKDDPTVQPFWDLLYAVKADVIIAGHNHHYERFAKQDPNQQADLIGIRQFVVGTGGAGNYDFSTPKPLSEARFTHPTVRGVIKFTLQDRSYDWSFVQTDGSIGDFGTNAPCNK